MSSKKWKKLILLFLIILVAVLAICLYFENFKTIDLKKLQKEQYVSDFVKKIRKNKNYKNYYGDKIKIAVVDSGLTKSHKDLLANVNGYNFIEKDDNVDDINGHGTKLIGIISAKDNDFGLVGIAPKAQIYPLKVLDKYGKSKIDTIIEALDWCLKNDMDIVNLSFSINIDNPSLNNKIQELVKSGIVIIASYSNLLNSYDYPAMYNGVIGVKSINEKKIIIVGNSVYAYGSNVITTDINNNYVKVSGNSFATAHVTGVVALIIEKYREEGESVNISTINNELKNFN